MRITINVLLIIVAACSGMACQHQPPPAPVVAATQPQAWVRGTARLRPGLLAPPGTALRVAVTDSNGDRVAEQVIPAVRQWPVAFDVPLAAWPQGKGMPIQLGVHVKGLSEGAVVLMSEGGWYDYWQHFSTGQRIAIELFPAVE